MQVPGGQLHRIKWYAVMITLHPKVTISPRFVMKNYSMCQSCGMPLKKDPAGGGTEADGSKSPKYCSYCYVDGKFTSPEIDTAAKMQAFVKQKMREQGFPGILAWFFSLGIPRLERWRARS